MNVMNKIRDGRLVFTNCKPSAYCSLGEIPWELTEENCICPNCGTIKLDEVKLTSMYYDGFNWENPSCPQCGHIFNALPIDLSERQIIIQDRKKLLEVLNRGAVRAEDISTDGGGQ